MNIKLEECDESNAKFVHIIFPIVGCKCEFCDEAY